jgi:hypothetical protein
MDLIDSGALTLLIETGGFTFGIPFAGMYRILLSSFGAK